jgi:hypothetical protein
MMMMMMMMNEMIYYMVFRTRCTDMHISLNGTEHIYIVMARLHMMIYVFLA